MTDAPEPDAVLLTRLATRLTAWYTLGGRLTATSSSIDQVADELRKIQGPLRLTKGVLGTQ